ncbi:hypothetical protein Glove_134g31 [Diversispora epigaea]|uniref:Uncharacterized protein n=1 Tax=Diversispora epigaea TaxID=1348612 RepID=A0A397IX34_9GLOM|nr:hypothetical protein Glove_134g31 [Diversispora epigaea]
MEKIEIEPEEYFHSQNISFDFADFSENDIQLLNEYTEDSLSERSKNENNNFEIYSNTSYNELHDPKLFVFNQEGYNNAYEKLENEIIQQLDDNRDDIDLLEDTEAITIESTNAKESDKTIIISEQSTSSFSPCVLLDLKDGKLQTCSETKNIKNINQLIEMEKIEIEPEEYFHSQNISFDFADFSENDIQLLNEYTEDSLSERSKNENNNFEIYSNTSYNELHDPKLFVFNQEGYNNAYEKLENEIIQQLDDNRDDIDLLEDTEAITIESTNAKESDKTIIISEQSTSSFSPCVLLDLKDGKLQTCSETKNIKNINQLIEVWQIDTHSAIEFEKGNLSLGVCMQHFNYDQRNHRSKIKQIRTIQQCEIKRRRCFFCNKYFYFYSRGKRCKDHSWNIFSKNFQVPCTGFFSCNSFCELQGISKKNYDEISRMRYICCECYEVKGGHLHCRPGPGKRIITCEQQDLHIKDVSYSLELLAKWLNHIAKTESEDEKLKILSGMLVPAINFNYTPSESFPFNYKFYNPTNNTYFQTNLIKLEPSKHSIPLFSQVPSLFFLEILFQLNHITENIKVKPEWNDSK